MQLINTFLINLYTRFNFRNRDEEGQTLVEYGLIIALIAVAVIAVLGLMGDELNRIFTEVKDEIAGAGTGGTPAPAPAP